MIPLQLILRNFLSYQEAILDFRSLHTACICGANGAGKSSLLEAITWVIWGQTRATTEDDLIHAGANNVRVDFEFICNYQTYRVIRNRPRGRSANLDFQVQTESGMFRSLSGKGLKDTQEKIIEDLRLDYDTFVNSAYLRQGRADEFMLRRPGERKQILADLLKLSRYEELAIQAKELAKSYKLETETLEQQLESMGEKLAQKEEITQEKDSLITQLKLLSEIQERDRATLLQLQGTAHQRQTWEQQLSWQQGQYQQGKQDCERLQGEITRSRTILQQLEGILQQEANITENYEQLQKLHQEEQSLARKFQVYQDLHHQKQQLEQKLLEKRNQLQLQLQRNQTNLENLESQEREIRDILAKSEETEKAVAQLNSYRQQLKQLDTLQQEISPLLQQQQNLKLEITRVKDKLHLRLEHLKHNELNLSREIAEVPKMRQYLLEVDAKLGELDKKKTYQERLSDKGLEKRAFQEKLQENQRSCEKQLEELRQKLEMLDTPDAACPLCERELNEEHRQKVINKTKSQHQEIQDHFWTLREQLTACERELLNLREEYSQIKQELANYDTYQQKYGELEAKLEATTTINRQLQQIKGEIEDLERSLVIGNYSDELQTELKQIQEKLQNLKYDEQTHALVREEERRWRWAELKQSKLEDARKRQTRLDSQKPELLAQIKDLETELANLNQNSPLKQQLQQLEQQIQDLGYDRTIHSNVNNALRQAQTWQHRHQELLQAQQRYPEVQETIKQLNINLQVRAEQLESMNQEVIKIQTQIAQFADPKPEIKHIEQQISDRRQQLDQLLTKKGNLEQTQSQLEALETQYGEIESKIKQIKRQYLVYNELSQAFGKNGIQALMIENVLPQLEAETNQILARLSGNQLHVQFVTQKASKSGSKKKTTKMIDTLDILIADASGTRPYETYSGGEAFRINFSIRLALARLLAQRSGTALQMLIVDEGFGTQDADGCERLIAAINAIASDFACILAVTHINQFKEAFQTRIEVHKTNQGSQLRLIN